jgi:hypothetical protein
LEEEETDQLEGGGDRSVWRRRRRRISWEEEETYQFGEGGDR